MAGAVVVRDEVHPRLDDSAPVAVGAHGVLDGGDDLGIGEAEGVYVRPGQETKPQSACRGHLGVHLSQGRPFVS